MASLRDLQMSFASALRGGERAAVARCIVANGIDPQRRVGIYVNNVRETFLGTLEATYPVLARIASEGVLFEDAIAQGTWTKVSAPSILTSLGSRCAACFAGKTLKTTICPIPLR